MIRDPCRNDISEGPLLRVERDGDHPSLVGRDTMYRVYGKC